MQEFSLEKLNNLHQSSDNSKVLMQHTNTDSKTLKQQMLKSF